MKKRILLTIPFILSALLIGCGKPDKNDSSVADTSDYILTDTSERADSNGKLKERIHSSIVKKKSALPIMY